MTSLGCPHNRACGVQRDRATRFRSVYLHRRLPSRWTISKLVPGASLPCAAHGAIHRAPTKPSNVRPPKEITKKGNVLEIDQSVLSPTTPVLDLMNTTRNVISLARATLPSVLSPRLSRIPPLSPSLFLFASSSSLRPTPCFIP